MRLDVSAWAIRNPIPPIVLFLVLGVLGVVLGVTGVVLGEEQSQLRPWCLNRCSRRRLHVHARKLAQDDAVVAAQFHRQFHRHYHGHPASVVQRRRDPLPLAASGRGQNAEGRRGRG